MKKLILVLVALIGLTVSAQTDSTSVKTSKYVAVGLSISKFDNTIGDTAYPSVEVGVTRNDVSYGIVFGRASLKGFASSEDSTSNYFYEVKVSPSVSLGYLNGNLVLGLGGYINQQGRTFTEFGAGVSKTFGVLTYGLSYTNWDKVNYVTPSVALSF